MESVYLLIEREFLKSECPIYKIGRSSQENDNRIKQYPKGSQLICFIKVVDSKFMENEMMHLFKHKYIQRKDIGSEYFEGNLVMMRKDMFDMVIEYDCAGFSECKKRQRGLKKLVLNELIKKTKKDKVYTFIDPLLDDQKVRDKKYIKDKRDIRDIRDIREAMNAMNVRDIRDEMKRMNERYTMNKSDIRKAMNTMSEMEIIEIRDEINAMDISRTVASSGLYTCENRVSWINSKEDIFIVLANMIATKKDNEQNDLLAQ